MLEGTLLEKLRRIESLYPGTRVDDEPSTIRWAVDQIRARRGEPRDALAEYSLPEPWKRELFLALCRRYGLTPYREPGMDCSTVRLRVRRSFEERTLWPVYLALATELQADVDAVTVHADGSKASEGTEPKALPQSSASPRAGYAAAARSSRARARR